MQLLGEACSQVQQMRALLECAWPASVDSARQPFRWATWQAAMSVILDRDGGDLTRTRRLGLARFEAAVRKAARCGCLRHADLSILRAPTRAVGRLNRRSHADLRACCH